MWSRKDLDETAKITKNAKIMQLTKFGRVTKIDREMQPLAIAYRRMHTCSIAWRISFYLHNKGRIVVTISRKNLKFVIFAISVKTVKSVGLL